MTSWKAHFAGSIGRPDAPLHFDPHSHHPWPDVTRTAHAEAWDIAARLLDRKWSHVFRKVVPEAQSHIARVLNLSDPETIAFAPSTHDFLRRILSTMPSDRPARILTSDGEFHSFSRQVARLEEDGLADARRVPVEPFDDFEARFTAEAQKGGWDLVYVSQVFFNSGFAIEDLASLVRAVPDATPVVIDGYHGFFARPTDLSAIEARIFYLSGGYKYAMAGEGCCFVHAPPGFVERPRDTGWFAAFGALSDAQAGVPYGPGGQRMMGATFDATGLYRLNAVMRWTRDLPLSVATADAHCRGLQTAFLDRLNAMDTALSNARLVLDPRSRPAARFLTFETPHAADIEAGLTARNVLIDRRADRLRFGFGIYQDEADVAALIDHLAALAHRPVTAR